uniref:Uncharacterized protein n=1 Tax=Ditylum brightwellii TaxID=49249 RepID=A0A7S4VX60_9STRA
MPPPSSSSSSSSITIKRLLTSHILVFIAGVYAGKQIDAEELEVYRSVHESASSKWKRRFMKMGLVVSAVGFVVLGIGRYQQRQHQALQVVQRR